MSLFLACPCTWHMVYKNSCFLHKAGSKWRSLEFFHLFLIPILIIILLGNFLSYQRDQSLKFCFTFRICDYIYIYIYTKADRLRDRPTDTETVREASTWGIVVNILDSDIAVSKFELQPRYYGLISLGKHRITLGDWYASGERNRSKLYIYIYQNG